MPPSAESLRPPLSTGLTDGAAWRTLVELSEQHARMHLRERFASDPRRFSRFSLRYRDWLLDYSKQPVDQPVMAALQQLWHEADVPGWIACMRSGDRINHTEGRAVRHIALRASPPPPEVAEVLARMEQFCSRVYGQSWRGASGEPIRHVVNIGIGGSDLGPRMAVRALAAQHLPGIQLHFVSNIDGSDLSAALAHCTPAHTLFIVASKTFTTQETLQNARSARQWLTAALGEAAVAQHFVALSSNLAETRAFGIAAENVFGFWDWVGGRFSIWSSIGLPVALAVGWPAFRQLLAGAADMDDHFFNTPVEDNLPACLALLEIWNHNLLGAPTRVVLPYSQSLADFPRYVQQLEMESNGKRVDRDGRSLVYSTAPIVWGEAGTNGQHAFYQLLHQGGERVPAEFIAFRRPDFDLPGHHTALLANCFAQSAALMQGRTLEEALALGSDPALAPYQVFPGNQPSTTLLLPQLDPYVLGGLLALYEHKVFVLGALWRVNAFDQWGVEYGKTLARALLPMLRGEQSIDPELDSSTAGLLAACLGADKP